VYTGFWWANLKERDLLKDSGIDVRIIICNFSKWYVGGINWIDLARDGDRWLALVNAI